MQCYYNVKSKGKEQNKKACRRADNQTTGTKQNNMKGDCIISQSKGKENEKIITQGNLQNGRNDGRHQIKL